MLQPPTEIIDFWFGRDTDDAAVAKKQAGLWWSKDAQVDAQIKQRFEATLLAATSGSLDAWTETAFGRLALILLSDQLPRNMYRNTPQSFAFDTLASNWCKSGLEQQVDQQLRPIQRVFYYLPLEHSESLDDQQLSVELFTRLAASVPPSVQSIFDGYLEFARKHLVIIERFGRFPHRNAILQRSSSAEEQTFLTEPGSSF